MHYKHGHGRKPTTQRGKDAVEALSKQQLPPTVRLAGKYRSDGSRPRTVEPPPPPPPRYRSLLLFDKNDGRRGRGSQRNRLGSTKYARHAVRPPTVTDEHNMTRTNYLLLPPRHAYHCRPFNNTVYKRQSYTAKQVQPIILFFFFLFSFMFIFIYFHIISLFCRSEVFGNRSRLSSIHRKIIIYIVHNIIVIVQRVYVVSVYKHIV